MTLDPSIILGGTVADVPGSFQRGLRFADEQRQFKENRELAPLRRQAAEQAVEIGDLKISAAERERELREARTGLVIAQRADTPEKWDTAVKKLGHDDLIGQFSRREELIANFEIMVEALDPSTPDEPRFFKGQRGAVNQILPDGQGGFTFKNIVPEGKPAAGGGKPSALHQRAVEGGLTPGTEEFQQFMITGGRSQFRVINDPVTKRLVVFDMQKLEIVGDAPEDAVVGESPPLPAGDTLFNQADDATGVLSAIGSGFSGLFAQLPGALGRFFFFEDIVKARKAYAISTQTMLQAFVVNPKFNVAEVERIKKEIGAVAGALTSPEEMRTNLRELDRFMRRKIVSQQVVANDEKLSTKERQAAATNGRLMQEYLIFMGVPQEGADESTEIDDLLRSLGVEP